MSNVYILSVVRSPIGRGYPNGALAHLTPINLSALILQAAVARVGLDPALIEDVIWGCVTPVGDQGANLARLSVLQAGFPVRVPAVTLNRMCGSGQQAIHFAAQAILAGDADLLIAGGTEMLSHQPLGSDWPPEWPTDFPYELVHQGVSAEMMAERWGLSREELDDFAYQSHLKAGHAIRTGVFASQTVEVPGPGGLAESASTARSLNSGHESPDERGCVAVDEGVRLNPDRVKMSTLKPVFKSDGVITAANSSQISDGSAAVVLASERAVREHHLTPLARLVSRVVVGSDPVLMLDGPIPATRQVLARAGLELEDIDRIEINEAFASVVLAWVKELDADLSRVNVNGGAIAHGHPLGATGAILMTKLVHELHRTGARYGLQTMCIGHGMATATVVERA